MVPALQICWEPGMVTAVFSSSNSFRVVSNITPLPNARPSGPVTGRLSLAVRFESVFVPAFGASSPSNCLNHPIGDFLEASRGDVEEFAALDASGAGRVD